MGVYRCDRCGAICSDENWILSGRSCQSCGAQCVCWMPSSDDIAAGRLLAQATWSRREERRRRRAPDDDVVEIVDMYRGWRRVNRREYDD